MKKALAILTIVSSTMFASAQNLLITVVVQMEDNPEYKIEKPNKNNLAICYMINKKFMAGITMADANTELEHADGFENIVKTAADMQILGRYYHTKEFFAQLTVPFTSDVENISAAELLQLGGGHSVNVWNNFYIEAYYAMLIKKDVNSDRKGAWYVGLSCRF